MFLKMFTIFLPLNLLLSFFPTSYQAVTPDDVTKMEILMPGVSPQEESNLCHAVKLHSSLNIVGYLPQGHMPVCHHMLVYGCKMPGLKENVWSCAEMTTHNSSIHTYKQGPVCGSDGSATILYAWAMDAPQLYLPHDVGFKVGPTTDVEYIVIQVHYADVTSFKPPNKNIDHSGVVLLTKKNEQPKQAGIYLMVTGGLIPAHTTTYMETACQFKEKLILHPFAYRTHTHSHGRVVTGYRVRKNQWTEIGRMDPRLPQMFYNVTNPDITIEPGDYLASRCTLVNDEEKDIMVGSTSADEMCNFYLMYYVQGNKHLKSNICFSSGPPFWSWSNLFSDDVMSHVPPEASIVPGTKDALKATKRAPKTREEVEELLEFLKKKSGRVSDDMLDGEENGGDEDEDAYNGKTNENNDDDWPNVNVKYKKKYIRGDRLYGLGKANDDDEEEDESYLDEFVGKNGRRGYNGGGGESDLESF